MKEKIKQSTNIITAFLLVMVMGLSSAVYFQNEKLEIELVNHVITKNEYESEIKSLLTKKNSLEVELNENRELYEKVKGISNYLEMDSISRKEIERGKQISMNTPLDFETALLLSVYAEEYEMRPSLLLSLMETESNFNQFLVGTHRDRGFMQIIPATERWLVKDFGSKVGMEYDPENIFDPEYNIGLSVMYLSFLKGAYKSNDHRMLSEYNRGPSRLKTYYQRNGTYATSYSKKIIRGESKYVAFND